MNIKRNAEILAMALEAAAPVAGGIVLLALASCIACAVIDPVCD